MSDPSLPPSDPSSFQPSTYEPLGYAAPNPPQRPTSVMVIGIIGIVLGALGVICAPISIVPFFITSLGAQNSAIGIVQNSTPLLVWTVAALVAQFLLSILLLAASIGSIMLKRWARSGMIAYAYAGIVMAILYNAVQCVAVVPQLFAKAQGGTPQQIGEAWGAVIGIVVGFVIALILPGFILIFFNKQNVKDAFDGGTAYRG